METKAQTVRKSAEGMGYGIAVLLPYLVTDVLGYQVPMEVMGVAIAAVSAFAARLRDAI